MSTEPKEDKENTLFELQQQVQEVKWEIRLIGHQIDRIFLSDSPSPPLPERTSERDVLSVLGLGEERLRRSESDLDQDQSGRDEAPRELPPNSAREGNRDESGERVTDWRMLELALDEMRRRFDNL